MCFKYCCEYCCKCCISTTRSYYQKIPVLNDTETNDSKRLKAWKQQDLQWAVDIDEDENFNPLELEFEYLKNRFVGFF